MAWFAVSPRDPADPRWPLPDRASITLKAEDAEDARAKFLEAYPSRPFGTPSSPVPDAGDAGFAQDPDALTVAPTSVPPSP
ncbi:hypothetical protein ASF60_11360 [Methylobacterium sp. Leaf113]|uniref:hypothetical protein n=1 Tax=Methylobacterium sp. Leaf113 TaxID=1736259 RepID=UPI0006F2AE4C|nr:hypothetical protein [Methylobacterium sp. Leaf113]KQP73109.1 hypothetical protein ASF60_11360 [Methylobacterium sp. Leaf113]